MPRTKVNPDDLLVLEIRITPPDGQPITDWLVNDKDFKQMLSAQEGGTPECRLHYHAYVECLRSRTWLIKWIYSIARCTNGEQGNAVFFTRKPHEHTIGYVVKSGNIACRHGCTDTFISEWLAKSSQYCADRDAAKKRRQRIEKSFTQQLRDKLEEEIKTDRTYLTPDGLLTLILAEYDEAHKMFPSRSVVETLINTLLYKYDDRYARAFYLKSFECR